MATPSAAASVPAATETEEIPDAFTCCICLDLLYKPVVLACGHMACFWCVHHSMSFRSESHCPICRNPYHHFPAICATLHFLLLKLYPLTSKRREGQVLEEEEKQECFSPQFDNRLGVQNDDCQNDRTKDLARPSSSIGDFNTSTNENEESPTCAMQVEASSTEDGELLSTDHVHCVACAQLFFHPVVLNCGHAFCDSCIVRPVDGAVRCQVCQSLHPRGTLKICLQFDQFLAEKFPEEYQSRREAAQLAHVMIESPTTGSAESSKEGSPPLPTEERLLSSADPLIKIHTGVGCDACGMCPIIGERHKCMDCSEPVGFDLCGDCYSSRSKFPGRFNQQHTPEHEFKHIVLRHGSMMRVQLRQLGGMVAANNYGYGSVGGTPTSSFVPRQRTVIDSFSSFEEEDEEETE